MSRLKKLNIPSASALAPFQLLQPPILTFYFPGRSQKRKKNIIFTRTVWQEVSISVEKGERVSYLQTDSKIIIQGYVAEIFMCTLKSKSLSSYESICLWLLLTDAKLDFLGGRLR